MIFKKKVSNIVSLNDAGFTLIEIMAAMVCFAIVALALGTMNATTWTQTARSKSHTEASVLAAQHLESLFSAKYAGEDENNSMSKVVTAGLHSFPSSDGHYTISYTIRNNDILPGTKSVQMDVTPNHGGAFRRVRYNYLLPLRK